MHTGFLDCENDDRTLRNKSRQTKFEFMMLPSEDDVEIAAVSVGTKMDAMPCTGPEDCLVYPASRMNKSESNSHLFSLPRVNYVRGRLLEFLPDSSGTSDRGCWVWNGYNSGRWSRFVPSPPSELPSQKQTRPSCGSRTWLSNSTPVRYIHPNSSLGMRWFPALLQKRTKIFICQMTSEPTRVGSNLNSSGSMLHVTTRHAVSSASLLLGRDLFQ